MIKKSIIWVATRYVSLLNSDVISKISLITLISIIVGVAASIVILSITNGFREDLKEKMIGKESHISLIARGLGTPNYKTISSNLISSYPWIKDAQPYYTGQGIIRKYADIMSGIMVNGITKESLNRYKGTFKLIKGEFSIDKRNILLAETLAHNTQSRVGDTVELIVKPPKEEELPVVETFKVSGIFSTGYGEFDSVLTVMSLENAQKLFRVGNLAYGISISVDDVEKVNQYKYILLSKLNKDFLVLTWQDMNRNLFEAMYNQKTVMIMILFFFFIVVAFGILGTMMSMVMDKKSEIAILKAIGMNSYDIMMIFMTSGAILGILGSFVGSVIGLLISVNLQNITIGIEHIVNFFLYNIAYQISRILNPYELMPEKFEFFKSNVYYIKSFPTKIEFADVAMISIFATGISVLAGAIPAYRASKLNPAEVLRNE